MDTQRMKSAIDKYRQEFEKRGIGKIDYPHDDIFIGSMDNALEHCHGMLDRMVQFLQEGNLEKCQRWIGFIQCALWVSGIYTLENMKDDNRDIAT